MQHTIQGTITSIEELQSKTGSFIKIRVLKPAMKYNGEIYEEGEEITIFNENIIENYIRTGFVQQYDVISANCSMKRNKYTDKNGVEQWGTNFNAYSLDVLSYGPIERAQQRAQQAQVQQQVQPQQIQAQAQVQPQQVFETQNFQQPQQVQQPQQQGVAETISPNLNNNNNTGNLM